MSAGGPIDHRSQQMCRIQTGPEWTATPSTFALIARCLQQVRQQQVPSLVLVTPSGRGALWFPQELEATVVPPLRLPEWFDLPDGAQRRIPPPDTGQSTSSGRVAGLRTRCSDRGFSEDVSALLAHVEQRPHSTTTALGRFGLAGLGNGQSIPFARRRQTWWISLRSSSGRRKHTARLQVTNRRFHPPCRLWMM